MAYTKYSLTPSSNTSAPPDGAPEGMLPSAVNDTMRDMMSQIRDCGDGIRGGTYTMTAPVITGGSISGATGSFTTLTSSGQSTFATSSGVVGIGTVSPSSWGSGNGVAQLGYSSIWGATSSAVCHISNNTYFDGTNYKAILNGNATDHYQLAGTYVWRNATSLTAGSTITFVDKMTLDVSGNLGIGTTSPDFKLEVVGGTNNGIHLKDAESATVYGGLFTQASALALVTRSNHALTFGTNDTERMRIDSSGNLLVGATTNYATLGSSVQVVNASGLGQYSAGTTSSALTFSFGRDNVTTGNWVFAFAGTVISSISASTGVYTPLSDGRVKKNIAPLQYGLNEVLNLNPVTYNMVSEEDSDKKHIGLIAQEVKSVMDETVDDLIDQENQMYGLDKSVLVPVLIKAIQEQQAMIEELKAKVAALEAA